jgi:uncharacterized integral membrane protein
MRNVRLLSGLIPAGALAIFAVENIRAERYRFLGMTFTGNVWWVVTGAALLGFLVAGLLLVPGRIAAAWRGRRLSRQAGRREHDLTTARAQDAQHQAELRLAIAERDHQHAQLAAAVAANSARPQIGAPADSRPAPADSAIRRPAQQGTLRIRLSDMFHGGHEPRTAESPPPGRALPREEPVAPRA